MPRSSVFLTCLMLLPGSLGAVDAPSTGPRTRLESTGHDQADDALPEKLASTNLPNPVRVHPKVISGGLPEGDAAFRELARMGVRTIISVDGALPDVAAATEHGLRYVHLPHGYDGIPQQRIQELAKAVRDLDGLIYIHCHHGKHRSPTAASVACVAAGMMPRSRALPVLEMAGTSPHYRGLFQSAEDVVPLNQSVLDALPVEYQATATVPPLAAAMVGIGHTHDRLNDIAASGWAAPPRHPDLDPAHEALLMREHFTELLRTAEVQNQPGQFVALLQDSESASQTMELTLRKWLPTRNGTAAPPELVSSFERLESNCKSCHVQFRDTPLREKHRQ
jgi:protein tyrosine phosphatase (PTP) superfamily phosphohydrolase (DUF442 family)